MSINKGLVYKDMHPHGYNENNNLNSPLRDPATINSYNPRKIPSNADEGGRATSLQQDPTLSHELATQPVPLKYAGAAQMKMAVAKDEDVRDLGWGQAPSPAPLIGGLDNEHVWMLIRRFNKQTYHVKETIAPPPGGLDMNVADQDEFSPDKLRSSVERLYMTVIISLIGSGKHVARLRSWRETRRTTYFASAYALAWILDMIMPMILTTVIVLIVYPPARPILFPPAPIAIVDSSTGGVKKPKAGVLGSTDSATGAPEHYKGEAVESEASHFVNGIAHVALSSAVGKHPADDPGAEDAAPSDSVPDPSALVKGAASARATAHGGSTNHENDKAKVPMETAIWNKTRPVLHGINDVSDTFERFANALSPIPPFPRDTARFRLAAVIAPLLAVSLVTSNYMFMKGVSFGVGFGFFGDPVIQRGIVWLNKNYPNWPELLELRYTLLKGVPTNAQLTITLLRIGEANHAPIPPPPRGEGAPPSAPTNLTTGDLDSHDADAPLGASPAEIAVAASHDPSHPHETKGSDIDSAKSHAHGKKGARILGFFKSSLRTTVETAIGADKLKAKAGSEHAKSRLGAIPHTNHDALVSGPTDFRARYNGKKGHVYLSTRATIPCVSFTTNSGIETIGASERETLHPVWSIAVADIREIKKVGGFGWKTRLVVGWALDKEVADGLEIVERSGTVWRITAVPLRDELFNRVVSMGGQKWESW